jgi:hypothetical protein
MNKDFNVNANYANPKALPIIKNILQQWYMRGAITDDERGELLGLIGRHASDIANQCFMCEEGIEHAHAL